MSHGRRVTSFYVFRHESALGTFFLTAFEKLRICVGKCVKCATTGKTNFTTNVSPCAEWLSQLQRQPQVRKQRVADLKENADF